MTDHDAACVPPTFEGRHLSERVVTLGMLHRRVAQQLLGAHGLHVGQERLLFLIADCPRPLGDLAAAMSVHPPTVTKMVNRLEAAGLVETRPSSEDGRLRLAALTAGGRVALGHATQAWEALERATSANLSADEQAMLVGLIDRCVAGLRDAVDRDDAGPTGC